MMASLSRPPLPRVVHFREGEASTAWMMFAYSFLAMIAYNIVKPIRDAQFISSLGADNLPIALFGSGLLVGLVMQAHGRGAARLPQRWIVPVTIGVTILLLLLFWLLFQSGAAWVSVAFYLFGQILGGLLVSQFWVLANDIYDARQAKRLFGFIGGGASLGGFTGSAITAFAASQVGTNNLLLVSAAGLTLCLGLVSQVVRRQHVTAFASPAADVGVGGGDVLSLLRSSRHLQVIAVVTAMAAIGSTIIGQQLNMAAEEIIGAGATDEMTALLGRVNRYLSGAAFLVQIALTSRIHHALGLGFALLVLPVSLGASAGLMLFNAALWAPGVGRGLDGLLRYTVDKTTREILFLPLSSTIKHRAKPFVDVTVDRLAKAAAALLLLLLIRTFGFDWQQLSYASLAVTAVWVVVAVRARREYLIAFRRSLEAHAVEAEKVPLNVADGTTIETLVEELSDPDEARVLNAIEMLETLDKRNLVTPLLLHHESPRVRTRALLALQSARAAVATRWLPAVERMLNDDDAAVRAAAVRALAGLRKEEASAVMRPHLRDPEPRVVATAAAALADAGTASDVESAYAALKRLTEDTRRTAARGREEAAAALGSIKDGRFRALLVPLISDPDLDVTRAALRSARPLAREDALFLPTLIALLGHRELKPLARDVLASYGEHFLEALEYFLKDHQEDIWVRRPIPATLAGIPMQQSMNVLVDALSEPDGFLRFKVIVAIEKLHRDRPELEYDRTPFEALALKEASRYYDYLTLHSNLVAGDPETDASLLVRALDDKVERALDRLYRVLGLLYSLEDVAAARRAIARGTPRDRAAALEYLDNLLSASLRKRVMPILEELPLEERVRHAHAVLKSRPRDLDDTLAQLIHDSDPVVAASAIHQVVRLGRWALIDDLQYVVGHARAVPYVADAARWALAQAGSRADPGPARTLALPAVGLVDRLRGILLFEFVSVDELFRIADAGQQVRHDAGRELYREGEQPGAVQFLLEGRVTSSDETGDSTQSAPTALAFDSLLEGSPLPHTIRTVDAVICLSLDSEAFLTMLSDNIVLAQGLFRMLLEGPAAKRWRVAYLPTRPSDGLPPAGKAGRDLQPLDKALRLREHPLLARATIAQLLEVAAVAHMVALHEGQVLFTERDDPATYHLLSGQVRLEAYGVAPLDAGPGATLGLAETLAGVPIGRQASVRVAGAAVGIDHIELFDVLADHIDLLQGIFSGLLRAEHTSGDVAAEGRHGEAGS